MTRMATRIMAGFALAMVAGAAQAEGNAKRGVALYRACIGCHSLEPGAHLTGPSLAGLWGRKAGQVDGFIRYSPGLKSADFVWDENTLNAWLASPKAMIPETYMIYRGLQNDQDRADLIAFLALSMAPDGAKTVVERGLARTAEVRGQRPDPLGSPPPEVRVTAIRHCRDSYFVTTANGVETPYWEMNVRLKLDTRETGPQAGRPEIVGAGMVGDRVSIVFSSLQELSRFITEKC
jgi:cytochrome c